MTVRIKSRDSLFQKLVVLKTNRNKRYKYNEFIVEGVRNINEAVRNKWVIKNFVFCEGVLSHWAEDLLKTVDTQKNYCLSRELMAELSGKEDHSELMAVVKMREDYLFNIKLSAKPLIVLFDRPSNKGNLGTMIRSCDAMGVDALLLTGHGVDLYDPDVVVSSMGSFFSIQVIRVSDNGELNNYIRKLKNEYSDLCIVGTTSHNEAAIDSVDLDCPLILMVGNETMGLNKSFKETCDVLCTIPMEATSAASSFNISCAATVMLYEAKRQRGFANG
ncbi:MAG: RNA methyltransferase [Clostridia bacterium]|nr:RNA methyltransferase [Clostridia bacterium]